MLNLHQCSLSDLWHSKTADGGNKDVTYKSYSVVSSTKTKIQLDGAAESNTAKIDNFAKVGTSQFRELFSMISISQNFKR